MEETAQEYHRTAQEIANNLNKAGHPVGVGDVLPVGELAYGLGSTAGDIMTGSSKIRTTGSRNFLGKFVNRLLKKRKPNEEVAVK